MEDVRWFKKILSNLTDVVWRMGQISRELQDYRNDIQYQWEDEASRELNNRYSNPQEDESKKMLKMLHFQVEKLDLLSTHLTSVYEILIKVNSLSSEVERLLERVKNEMDRAYANYGNYKENYSISKNLLPKVYDLIGKANSMAR
ncbi:MAG: hypothetical protein KAS32_20730 [Candidatus Peribacteraceae bacterium]|nr:hypothetical protein [Candidatus Peribacteraceae bacterium]